MKNIRKKPKENHFGLSLQSSDSRKPAPNRCIAFRALVKDKRCIDPRFKPCCHCDPQLSDCQTVSEVRTATCFVLLADGFTKSLHNVLRCSVNDHLERAPVTVEKHRGFRGVVRGHESNLSKYPNVS